MEQINIFDCLYPSYKINKPIRLIELFAGVGSQAMALKTIGYPYELYKTSDWEVHAVASYKAIHHEKDNKDYSVEIKAQDLPQALYNIGISNDGKNPMTLQQIERKGEKWQRQTYKQAGNSIVKNVLVAIISQLIPGKENIYKSKE